MGVGGQIRVQVTGILIGKAQAVHTHAVCRAESKKKYKLAYYSGYDLAASSKSSLNLLCKSVAAK